VRIRSCLGFVIDGLNEDSRIGNSGWNFSMVWLILVLKNKVSRV